MRALHISTRLAGTDGVSLETAKVAKALEVLGFETAYCAGKLDETGPLHRLVPELHFRDPIAVALGERAFGDGEEDRALERDILERAELLKAKLLEVVDELRPNLLVLQNVWAIPMQLPLAKALAEIVVEKTLPTLSHEHDYPWERERFLACRVPRYLDYYFPFDAATARHLAINSPAQRELKKRRGLTATVVPNVFDFDAPAPGIDEYNADFREAFGLAGKRLFLQPTRVIPRKGIELAIDLLAELGDAENVLVITHRAGDEGMEYLGELERYADERGVDMHYVAEWVDEERSASGDTKIYSLWDSYPHADFVTYPSLYEGFGNALLEMIYFKKPALVNRYSVYAADIAPKGFSFVEIDGKITPEAVASVRELLDNPSKRREMVERNYRIARRHFSYRALREVLKAELESLGFELA